MQQFIYPVNVFPVLISFIISRVSKHIGIIHISTRIFVSCTQALHVGFSLADFRHCRPAVYTKKSIKISSQFSFFSAFGSNDYNTIGTGRTINSRRRSIFQHFNRFNIIRIQCRIVTRHPVNNKHRITTCCQ